MALALRAGLFWRVAPGRLPHARGTCSDRGAPSAWEAGGHAGRRPGSAGAWLSPKRRQISSTHSPTAASGRARSSPLTAATMPPKTWGRTYLRICQRNVDGAIVPGTKSSRYPEKDVFLLGPLAKTLARPAAAAGPDGLLFPYPGTERLWTESEYRNWRVPDGILPGTTTDAGEAVGGRPGPQPIRSASSTMIPSGPRT